MTESKLRELPKVTPLTDEDISTIMTKIRELQQSRILNDIANPAWKNVVSTLQRIRWVNVYYPSGQWENECGNVVKIPANFNFRASFEGREILVIQGLIELNGVTGYQPQFLDAMTLEKISQFDVRTWSEYPWIEAPFK